MDEVVTNAGTQKANRYLATISGPNAFGFFDSDTSKMIWSHQFMVRGLANGESGATNMEGNFSWAKPRYLSYMYQDGYTVEDYIRYFAGEYSTSITVSDWYPHQFDGDPASEFTL